MAAIETETTHRSVSAFPPVSQAEVNTLTAELKERVQDLLLHWVNAQLAVVNANFAVLSVDDLADGSAHLCIVKQTLARFGVDLIAESQTAPAVALTDAVVALCRECTAFPVVQPLLAFCPYAGSHLNADRILKPDNQSWYYWLIATALVATACVGPTLDLRRQSDFHAPHAIGLNSLLRRPLPEVSTDTPWPLEKSMASSLRGGRKKTDEKAKRSKSFAKTGAFSADQHVKRSERPVDVERDTVAPLFIGVGADSDAVAQLDDYNASLVRFSQWHGIGSLISIAIVELNCIEYDQRISAFRYSVPVVASETAAALVDSGRLSHRDVTAFDPSSAVANQVLNDEFLRTVLSMRM